MSQPKWQFSQPPSQHNNADGLLDSVSPIYLQPWHTFSHITLQTECKSRDLPSTDTKLDLIKRLLADDKNNYKLANPLFLPSKNAAQQDLEYGVYEAFMAHQFEIMARARQICGCDGGSLEDEVTKVMAENEEKCLEMKLVLEKERSREQALVEGSSSSDATLTPAETPSEERSEPQTTNGEAAVKRISVVLREEIARGEDINGDAIAKILVKYDVSEGKSVCSLKLTFYEKRQC